jgi:hypothetical protein
MADSPKDFRTKTPLWKAGILMIWASDYLVAGIKEYTMVPRDIGGEAAQLFILGTAGGQVYPGGRQDTFTTNPAKFRSESEAEIMIYSKGKADEEMP